MHGKRSFSKSRNFSAKINSWGYFSSWGSYRRPFFQTAGRYWECGNYVNIPLPELRSDFSLELGLRQAFAQSDACLSPEWRLWTGLERFRVAEALGYAASRIQEALAQNDTDLVGQPYSEFREYIRIALQSALWARHALIPSFPSPSELLPLCQIVPM